MDPADFRGPLPPGFTRRRVRVAPGAERAYDAREWRDAIVLVESGELHLVGGGSGGRRFRAGDVIALSDLPVRALRNGGTAPAVLVAVARGDEFRRAHPS